jgi:hypothetical protein
VGKKGRRKEMIYYKGIFEYDGPNVKPLQRIYEGRFSSLKELDDKIKKYKKYTIKKNGFKLVNVTRVEVNEEYIK